MLAEQMRHVTGHRPSPAEIHSWDNSIPRLVADLRDAGLSNVELLLEYRLPLSSKRADVVIAGHSRRTGEPLYLVVELKQWSEARLFEDNPNLVTVPNWMAHPLSHPVEQVREYCDHIADYTTVLGGHSDRIAGVAYLHNATDSSVHDLLGARQDARGRLFTGQRRGDFVDYLRDQFTNESGRHAADELVNSYIAPSKQLLAVAAEEVQRREVYRLLDEQRDAFELVRHAVTSARRANTKTAIVVSGGPGSGKSVIALSLLGELTREGRTVLHATGSKSFTLTLRKVAGRGNTRVQSLFKYFNSFMEAEPNDLECLILDEAHRIRETSVNRYTRKELRGARPQIEELLSAARVPVFLLDEYQVVRPGELGNVADIKAAAASQGIEVITVSLNDQFRCGGSEAYVHWVLRLLELETGGPIAWDGDANFAVQIFDSPVDLETWLSAKQAEGLGARIAAGYCWPWSNPRQDGTLVADVRIGEWERPWNLKGDRSVGGAPPSPLWATDPAGFGQVGCVYTAQGFEYDYAGVILGPDLVRRNNAWVFVRNANKDPDFRNTKRVSDIEFETLIKNVYKVLLTRGMQGVGIYSTDAETRDFLRSLLTTDR